jgi:membrane peptidoglycan carboxypeptidase
MIAGGRNERGCAQEAGARRVAPLSLEPSCGRMRSGDARITAGLNARAGAERDPRGPRVGPSRRAGTGRWFVGFTPITTVPIPPGGGRHQAAPLVGWRTGARRWVRYSRGVHPDRRAERRRRDRPPRWPCPTATTLRVDGASRVGRRSGPERGQPRRFDTYVRHPDRPPTQARVALICACQSGDTDRPGRGWKSARCRSHRRTLRLTCA